MNEESFSLLVISSPPYLGRQSHEILEAALALALFDTPFKVVFIDEGVAWCVPTEGNDHHKSLYKQLKAMPMYGADELFVCQEHADHWQVTFDHETFEAATEMQIATWLSEAKFVEVF